MTQNNPTILHINDQTYNLADHTPMMVQYLETKVQYPHALLLYRMGDFYELFFEDAKLAAQLLDITLTRRGKDKAGKEIPMAGVPFHAADSYMARMIAKGQTVVICEQVEESPSSQETAKQPVDKKPASQKGTVNKGASKGIMKREVVRTLTAGTITEEALITHNDASHTPCVVAIEFDLPKSNNSRPHLTSPSSMKTGGGTPLPLGGVGGVSKPNQKKYQAGISRLDISAGQIICQQITSDNINSLKNELTTVLARFAPSECLVNENLSHNDTEMQNDTSSPCEGGVRGGLGLNLWLEQTLECPIIHVASSDFSTTHAPATICQQFGVSHLDGLGMSDSPLIQATTASLIHYARQTQQRQIPHVNQLSIENNQDYLILDDICQRNLEIFSSVSQNGTTLINVLNHCQTPMGKRLLPEQLKRPIRNKKGSRENINLRADAIEQFVTHNQQIDNLRDVLANIADIERISSRISLANSKPRDLRKLADSIRVSDNLTNVLATCQIQSENKGLLPLLLSKLPPHTPILNEIADLLERAIVDEPPAHIRDGGMIKSGFDPELDRLTHLHDNVQETLDEMAEQHRQTYKLPSLKVGFNKVSGFYFELPKIQALSAPDVFIRRQTLKSCERYITDELKQVETDYLNAHGQALAREKQLYGELLGDLSGKVGDVQQLAQAIAQLDVLINWAKLAVDYRWTRPTLSNNSDNSNHESGNGTEIDIRQGRHLVVEAGLLKQQNTGVAKSNLRNQGANHFVANDCVMDSNNHLLLITGPNMGGKSTYMRQVALIVLLASCGSFVPAESATIGDIDRIFTRIGSADDLAGGKSTFMVEMIETAHILNLASEKSLVLMDEVGRGTSTTDGLAMAYACVNRLTDMGCLTLFATHYFELTALADTDTRMHNVHVVASEVDGKLLLLHKIKAGSASSSFGLHVAKMAGVPITVIDEAQAYLLENTSNTNNSASVAISQQSNSHLSQSTNLNSQGDLFTGFGNTDNVDTAEIDRLKKELAELKNMQSLIDSVNPDEMTPRDALEWVYGMKSGI